MASISNISTSPNGAQSPNPQPIPENFIPSFKSLLRLYGPTTAAIYGQVWLFSRNGGKLYAEQDWLARELGVTRATINRNLKKLVRDGYIIDLTPRKRGHSHSYIVSSKLEGCNKKLQGCDLKSQLAVTKSYSKRESNREIKREESPALSLFKKVVSPSRITKGESIDIQERLGESPDEDRLITAYSDWQAKVRSAHRDGKRWNPKNVGAILDCYEESSSPQDMYAGCPEFYELTDNVIQ